MHWSVMNRVFLENKMPYNRLYSNDERNCIIVETHMPYVAGKYGNLLLWICSSMNFLFQLLDASMWNGSCRYPAWLYVAETSVLLYEN